MQPYLFQLLFNLSYLTVFEVIFTIVTNVNLIFFTLWLLVLISLACTAAIKLIYLVLNLSILSLLLWMFSTEINIIILVYILAFIGPLLLIDQTNNILISNTKEYVQLSDNYNNKKN